MCHLFLAGPLTGMVNSDTSQVSLVLKAEKSGGREAKGENRTSEIRRGGMRAVESIIGGQRSRGGKIETRVTPTEWIPDAWDRDMKYQHSSLGPSLTF